MVKTTENFKDVTDWMCINVLYIDKLKQIIQKWSQALLHTSN